MKRNRRRQNARALAFSKIAEIQNHRLHQNQQIKRNNKKGVLDSFFVFRVSVYLT